MKAKRPVNLDLTTIRQPVAAIASITHRVSGVIVFLGIAGLLCLLDVSLTSEEDFNSVQAAALSPFVRFLLWGVLAALAYHLVAGVKHLFLDFGIGESKEGGPRGAQITFVLSIVLIVLLGVWLW
jgi:succinate dehydrogenase / fumarate reductase, cytochrome b subunit